MDNETFTQVLGVRLRLARKAAGYTQEAIAGRVGVVRTQVANIEAGRSTVSAEQLALFAAYYGQPVGYFYGETPLGEPGPHPPAANLIRDARELAARLESWAASQERIDALPPEDQRRAG